jgi:alpha-mannosidase
MALQISLYAQREAVDISARVLWDERSARLKLVMPGFNKAEFEVPGAVVRRGERGEVPGGRWVRAFGAGQRIGFASDSLYAFDCTSGEFRATVARASRYADSSKMEAHERPWQPVVDCGELKFRFLISPGEASLTRLAEDLEQPPVVVLVPPHKGTLPRSGSLASLEPASLQLLALKQAEDGKGLILRVRNTGPKTVNPALTWLGRRVALSAVKGQAIASWRLRRTKAGWKASATTTLED